MARKPVRSVSPARSRLGASREGRARLQNGSRGCIAIGPSDALTRSLKTSETVARDVVHDIIVNGLQPGDNLAPEAAMLELYAVSRESLREGLRLLEVQGLITIRRGPGGGPIVGTVDPANLGRISTLYYHMAGATYRELFEAWVLSESLLAERAARHPDPDERLSAMAPYLEPTVADVSSDDLDDLDEFVQVHTRFHSALAALAGNRVLELTLQTMGQIVSHHVAVTDDPRTMRAAIAEDHHRLARAIVAGHAHRARSIMEAHIEKVARVNEQHMGQRMDDYIEWH
jgi:GntR family transcriptional regulator, transcriptional repressor for pyruvate dehydrogenase complex